MSEGLLGWGAGGLVGVVGSGKGRVGIYFAPRSTQGGGERASQALLCPTPTGPYTIPYLPHRFQDAIDDPLDIAAPTQDDDQIALRLDEDDVAAGAAGGKGLGPGQIGHGVVVVEPP